MNHDPKNCSLKVSYGDYHIYTAVNENIGENHCNKLDVLGRVLFMAGSKLVSFRPCNIVDFVVKSIKVVNDSRSLEEAEHKTFALLKKGWCGIPYYRIQVDNDGNYVNLEQATFKAKCEAIEFLKELWDWKRCHMI